MGEWWRRPAVIAGAVAGAGALAVFLMVAATVGVFFAGGGSSAQAGAGAAVAASGVPARWGLETPDVQRVAWAAIVAKVGCPQLTRADWVIAVAIEIAESGANTMSHNPIPPDDSYGLWQINMLGALGPPRRVEYGIASNDELYDAVTNAKAMCIVSGGGTNWRPWSTFTNYAYWDHLPDAEAAVTAAERGTAGIAPSGAPTGNLVDLPPEWCGKSDGTACQLDASWAPNVAAAFSAVLARTGIHLVAYSANRTYEYQAMLYAKNCPDPSCPGGLTARPGTSNHEGGQAVDVGRWGCGIDCPLSGPGDPAWEALASIGPQYGVFQCGPYHQCANGLDMTQRDTPHFSATGN